MVCWISWPASAWTPSSSTNPSTSSGNSLYYHFKPTLSHRNKTRGWILGRNPDKSLEIFLRHSHLCSFALKFIFLQTYATSYSFWIQLLYPVKEKGEKPDKKPYPLPYGLRNPYRNLKSENFQDYTQKPQRNYTFINSASVLLQTFIDQSYMKSSRSIPDAVHLYLSNEVHIVLREKWYRAGFYHQSSWLIYSSALLCPPIKKKST